MDLTYILLAIAAALLLVLAVCVVYFFVYKRHINKAITEPEKKRVKLPSPLEMAGVLAIIAVAAAALLTLGRTSSVADIEGHIRENAGESSTVEVAMNDKMAAAIAYDAEGSCTYAIYKNSGKLMDDYVFRHGGKSTAVRESVRVFKLGGDTAIISMNKPGISVIESHGGERYEIDPNSPFAVIFSGEGFDLYGADGELIIPEDLPMYEITTIE